jgi:dihydropteroate synthase
MGVVNVTPDSFYDGGRYLDADAAVAHGRQLIAHGADIIDVGGESSRPGAAPVEEREELRRVLPVIDALAGECRISVDTMKPEVARAAVACGATLINDVACCLEDVAAETGAGLVVMHMRGNPQNMQDDPRYDDVADEVFRWLEHATASARRAGVNEVYVDPGIGFGKTIDHNLELLKALPELVGRGTPVVLGTSRKRFIGAISAPSDSGPLPPEERLEGSLATAVWGMTAGVAVVRVHDVRATAQATRIVGNRHADQGDLRIAAPA